MMVKVNIINMRYILMFDDDDINSFLRNHLRGTDTHTDRHTHRLGAQQL